MKARPAAIRPWPVAEPSPLAGPTIWRVGLTLDEVRRPGCRALLSMSEQARADRFLRAEDRDRYVASHAALRIILAGALAAQARDLTFGADASGKPHLSGPWRGRLQFNLSHSGGFALVGLAPDMRIGVDIEAVRPFSDCLAIARCHFAADEAAALAALPPQDRTLGFLACWTCKEAFVKAVGLGLTMDLDRFSVAVAPAPPRLLSIDGDVEAARAWRLDHLEPAPQHVGAVAIEARAGPCRLLSLPPDWSDRSG